jgi:hypothetical protein
LGLLLSLFPPTALQYPVPALTTTVSGIVAPYRSRFGASSFDDTCVFSLCEVL